MGKDEKLDDFIRRIERLSISDDEKAFLVNVCRQYEGEMAEHTGGQDKPDTPLIDQ